MPALVHGFAAARMGVGLLSWASPSRSARVFGLDPNRNEPIVTQLFGARECALAVATAATSGDDRRRVLALGVAIDGADTLASLLQVRKGAFSTQATVMTAAGAALFALIGATALVLEGRDGAGPAPQPVSVTDAGAPPARQ